jgi:signal transduction histidine kinase
MVLEDILQRLNAAVLFIDSDHRIRWMNRRAQDWFDSCSIGDRRLCYRTHGYGLGFCNICPTGTAIDRGTPAHYEFTLPIDGQARVFEVIAIPLSANENMPASVVEFVMDVTGGGMVKIKENEMMVQIEKMVALGQLAAGVAHELNTPLGTISIISNEFSRALEGVSGKEATMEMLREYLADMQGEIVRCKTIIKDLLDFSKIGLASFVETDINAMVSKTVDFVNKGNKGCAAKTSKILAPVLPLIMTDPDRFRQVLFNVIKNAVESVEDDEYGSVAISTQVDACFVGVSIKDNGSGIPEGNMKRIFEPFFTTKPIGRGTGLGLSVSYGIMKDLKGEIRVASKVGEGTTVTLLLPV